MSTDLYSTNFTMIGYIAFWISFAIILFFFFITFVSFLSKREIPRKQMLMLFVFFIVALSVWALLWDPAPYYDSYKHFLWLDQIRANEMTLVSFLKNGFIGSRIGNYRNLIAFNILRYAIVSVTANNHALPFVCTLIDYIIFYYITKDFFDSQKISYIWMFVLWVMSFSFLSYFMVVSGIRNAFAASIAALAIYRKLYKGKGLLEYGILSLIVATIHPNALLPMIIAMVYPVLKGYKSILLLFFCSFLLRFGAQVLQASGIGFLVYVGGIINFYLNDFIYYGEMTTYVADIIVIVCCLLMLYKNRKRLSIQKSKIDDFSCERKAEIGLEFCKVYLFVLLAMAFVGGTNFLTRGGYVLGFLSVFMIKPFTKINFSLSRSGFLNIMLISTIIIASLTNIGHEFLLLLAQFF